MPEPDRSSSRRCRRRRASWQSAPGSTRTCAASAGKPLVTVQTWRSCTSTTSGSSASACATASGSIPAGDASRKMRPDSRSSVHAERSISAATKRPATESSRFQPVSRISPPATAVPMNAARSVTMCRYAPRMFRLPRSARESTPVAARFTTIPASATTSTIPPRTSGGEISRRIAEITIHEPTRSSVMPFACAARISARPSPKVHGPCAGRAASRAATSAAPSANASVSMCPASARSATDPATTAAAISAAMNARISPSAIASARRSRARCSPGPCSSACACTVEAYESAAQARPRASRSGGVGWLNSRT